MSFKLYDFIYKIDEFCNYQNQWNFRAKAYTSDKYGVYPDKRPLEQLIKNSIINLDKPPGPTSHEVAYWIKKMFNLNKAGHGGTLEPYYRAGSSQGFRSASYRFRECYQNNELHSKKQEGIYMSHATPL